MASNLYRRGEIWWCRYQVGGREVRRSLRTSDRAEARRRLRPLLAAAERQRAEPLRPATERVWEEAAAQFLTVGMRDLRPGTRARYETSLRMLHGHFAGRRLGQITGPFLHAYAVARMADGASAATVRRDLTVVSRVLDLARRAGWTTTNPAPEESRNLAERREPIRPVPLRSIAIVARRAASGFGDLIRFAARTGCRQEEAGSLTRQDIDFARGEITFARTKTRSPRVIRMTPALERMLLRWLAAPGPPDQPVFRTAQGQRLRSLKSRWRNLIEGAGVPRFRFHDLRHTFAVRWLQRGGSIYALARQLGHSTVQTTERYSAWLARSPE
jgi:integrase